MRNVRRTAAYAAMTLVFLAACDGGDDEDVRAAADSTGDPAAASTTITAGGSGSGCALVDEAALEQAVGFDVTMNDNSTGNCLATAASGAVTAPTIDFRSEPRTAAFDYFSAQPDATPVENLGDRAVWATLNETTGYVVAVSGDRSIVVGIGAADGVTADSRRQAEAVARLLLTTR